MLVNIISRVIDFKPTVKRMFVLRIRGKFKNYSYICAHAPMEEDSENEEEKFYEKLDWTYKQYPSYNIKSILDDMNAKVGKEIWTGIAVGTLWILHYASNDNRTLLINYAVHQCMVLQGILFAHRNMHTGTCHGSDDRAVNQLDHVMINQQHCSNLSDVRSYNVLMLNQITI